VVYDKLESQRPPIVIQCSRSSICIRASTLRTIPFLHGNTHVGTGMDSPTWTACWPKAIGGDGQHNLPCRRADVANHVGTKKTTGQSENTMPPLQAILHIVGRA